MTREPWTCPKCGVILAPHVDEHRCEGQGGSAAQPVTGVRPWAPPGGSISITTPTTLPGTAAMYGNTYGGGSGGGVVIDIGRRSCATFTRDIA